MMFGNASAIQPFSPVTTKEFMVGYACNYLPAQRLVEDQNDTIGTQITNGLILVDEAHKTRFVTSYMVQAAVDLLRGRNLSALGSTTCIDNVTNITATVGPWPANFPFRITDQDAVLSASERLAAGVPPIMSDAVRALAVEVLAEQDEDQDEDIEAWARSVVKSIYKR
ncbi:hypothetical protein ACTJK4_24990 [Ralstonia sp. 22111]|uniref:hypothetical protein n=1 Tax=Ralstonia sp. 22111 TaxID=3453878 RepID=UPI003F82E56D